MQLIIPKYVNDKDKHRIIADFLKVPVKQIGAQDKTIRDMLADINIKQAEFDKGKKVG